MTHETGHVREPRRDDARAAFAWNEPPLTAREAPELAAVWANRDLGWLEFNRRVLAEALDGRVPLLERVKFLAIFSSNLDEFFMKRIAAPARGLQTRLPRRRGGSACAAEPAARRPSRGVS